MGCEDDVGKENPTQANIVYEFLPSSGPAVFEIWSTGVGAYMWNFTLTMRETNGIGVRLERISWMWETDGYEPIQWHYYCDSIAREYRLNDCYLPGSESAIDRTSGLGYPEDNWTDPQWTRIKIILVGTDDRGNNVSTTALFEGTGYQESTGQY